MYIEDLSVHLGMFSCPQMVQQKPPRQHSHNSYLRFLSILAYWPIDVIMAANWWSHWERWWPKGEWGHKHSTTHKRSLIRPVPSLGAAPHSPRVSVFGSVPVCHPSLLISLIPLQLTGNLSPPHGRSSIRASGGITTSHSFALLLVLKTGIQSQRRRWPSKVDVHLINMALKVFRPNDI